MIRSLLRWAIPLAIACLASTPASAEPFRKMPWHLADIWWRLDKELDFEDFAIDVTVESDPGNDVDLYIAPTGLLRLNGISLYGGIQTRTNFVGRGFERGFLFSRWDERGMGHVRPAPGMVGVSQGTEGDFISVRGPYDWSAGAYEVRVRKLPAEKDEENSSWVRYEVCARALNACASPGDLKFPGRTLKLGENINAFIEIYRKAVPPERIPHTVITFGNLRVNGRPVAVARIHAAYPQAVPDHAKARLAPGHSVRVELGPKADRSGLPVNRSGARIERLFPAAARLPGTNEAGLPALSRGGWTDRLEAPAGR